MRKILLAVGAALLSSVLMGQAGPPTPGLNMIELPGHDIDQFPCKDKNRILKRSQCVDFRGYGGVPGMIFVENYIIHCMKGGTLAAGQPVTYVTWTRIGQCTPDQLKAQEKTEKMSKKRRK